MTAIFISHSSTDNAAATDLKAWVEAKGHTSFFLDFDPDAGIKGGASWEQTLYQQLRQCQAVIVLLTPSWLASEWCFAEPVQARERGKAIFPIKVQQCDAGGVLGDIQHIDLTTDPEGYRRLELGLKERGSIRWMCSTGTPNAPRIPACWPLRRRTRPCSSAAAQKFSRSWRPWTGSGARDATRPASRSCSAASGSGKSSLARAGVFPGSRNAPPNGCRLHAAAGRDPVDVQALLTLARDLAIAARQPDATVLLTIDQAEELFGYSPAEVATRFLRLLRAALEVAGRQIASMEGHVHRRLT